MKVKLRHYNASHLGACALLWIVLAAATAPGMCFAAPNDKLSAASINLGGWVISVDGAGNLTFTTPDGIKVTKLFTNGDISVPGAMTATGSVTAKGKTALTEKTSVWIENDQGWLNGTPKINGGGATGWRATPYWRSPPLDRDSPIEIWLSSP